MDYRILGGDHLTVQAGETLLADICISNRSSKPTKIRGIAVQFLGSEKTNHKLLSSTQVLEDEHCKVFKNGSDEEIKPRDSVRLDPGDNVFTLKYGLKDDLPPSGRGTNWSITYKVRVFTKWSIFKIRRKRCEATITVRPHLNLFKKPFCEVSDVAILQSSCVHWGQQAVTATLHLQSSGWLIKEPISGRARVSNFSQSNQRVVCSLLQIEQIKVLDRVVRQDEKTVAMQTVMTVSPGRSGDWEGFLLNGLPGNSLPTGLLGSDKIHISYMLQLSVTPESDVLPALVIRAPVFIGTTRSLTHSHSAFTSINHGDYADSDGTSGYRSMNSVIGATIANPSTQRGSFQTSASNVHPSAFPASTSLYPHLGRSEAASGHQTRAKEVSGTASRGASTSRFSRTPSNLRDEDRTPLLGEHRRWDGHYGSRNGEEDTD